MLRRIVVAALALTAAAIGLAALLLPGTPPKCGSLTQLIGVEINDKHDRCGEDALFRAGVAAGSLAAVFVLWQLWPKTPSRGSQAPAANGKL